MEIHPEDRLFSKADELLQQTSVVYNNEQLKKLCDLVLLLSKWNKSLNLTAVKSEEEMVVRHILDCAVVSPYIEGENIADVGTGAGFPGLVLAILNRDKKFSLIDSVSKKTSFVQTACIELGLENVTVINGRCEDLRPEKCFDLIVSRAFAPLKKMVNICIHLLDDKGCFLAMKANLEHDEINEIPDTVKIENIIQLDVPELNAKRQIIKLVRTGI